MTNLVTSITGVFEELVDWLISSLNAVGALFYTTDGGLTFVGTLCIIGLGIGIGTMLVAMIRSLVKMRG